MKVEAITSNPCFELWYLLHYSNSTKSYTSTHNKSPCDNLIADLKKYALFATYDKGSKGYFEALSHERRGLAIKNALSIRKQSGENGDTPHHGNPVTHMDILLEGLEQVSDHNKEVEQKKRNLSARV